MDNLGKCPVYRDNIFVLPKKIIFMWPKSMLASVDLWESSVSASLKINKRIQLLWIMHSKQMEINLSSSTLHIYVQKSLSCVKGCHTHVFLSSVQIHVELWKNKLIVM